MEEPAEEEVPAEMEVPAEEPAEEEVPAEVEVPAKVEVLVISWKSLLSQMASFDVSVTAIYSASVLDRATVGCLLNFQLTAPPEREKT